MNTVRNKYSFYTSRSRTSTCGYLRYYRRIQVKIIDWSKNTSSSASIFLSGETSSSSSHRERQVVTAGPAGARILIITASIPHRTRLNENTSRTSTIIFVTMRAACTRYKRNDDRDFLLHLLFLFLSKLSFTCKYLHMFRSREQRKCAVTKREISD